MKTSLKTFPNWNKPIPDYEEAKIYITAIWDWLENFTKELQERLNDFNPEDYRAEIIKEILGE